LSRANVLAAVPVALTPFISEMFKKAKAEAQRREMERRMAAARKGHNEPQAAKPARPKQLANIRNSNITGGAGNQRSQSAHRAAVAIRPPSGRSNERRVRVASAIAR
jgi:hypothetical protein